MLDNPLVIVWAGYVFGLTQWLRNRMPKLDGWLVLLLVVALSAAVVAVEHNGAFVLALFLQKVGATALGAIAIEAGIGKFSAKPVVLDGVLEVATDDRPTDPPSNPQSLPGAQ